MRLPSPVAALPVAHPPPPLVLVAAAGGIVCALLAGVLVARSPVLGVAFGAAAIFGPIALTNLQLGIALWTATMFISVFPGVSLAFNISGILLVFAWIGMITGGRAATVRAAVARVGPAGVAYGLFILWAGISMAWATDIGDTQSEWLYWAVTAVTLFVIASALDRPDRLRLVAGAFVAGAVISVVVGALSGDLTQSTNAIDTASESRFGAGNDPNDLAAGLVPALALAFGVLAAARPGPLRLACMLAVPILVVGLVATQSRGGLIAAAVSILAAIAIARGRRLPLLAGVLAITVVGTFALLTTPGALERVTTVDNGGNGRSDLWTIAWRMASDNPIAGVGFNQFRVESEAYVRQPGNLQYVDLIVEKPHVVHNTYLQLFAETGAIGLLLFLAAVGLCVRAAWRAARRFAQLGRPDLGGLAQGIFVAQLGFLVAAFFLTTGDDFRAWFVLGLGPAALAVARGMQDPTHPSGGRIDRAAR